MAEEKRARNLERLRNMNDQELADELAGLRHQLFDKRRENVTKQLENTATIARTKKQIARILTLQTERSRA